jgi:hypothetical protein
MITPLYNLESAAKISEAGETIDHNYQWTIPFYLFISIE